MNSEVVEKGYRSEFAEIWETLASIDVSKHIEKKLGLSYLSWAWAWATLMEEFPDSTYAFSANEVHQDGSETVHCTIQILNSRRSMWLPVMDHKNNAIIKPSARQVSDAKMRCLVKTMAMFGLGHYIYAGEDLPEVRSEPKEQKVETKPKQEPKKDPNEDVVPIAKADLSSVEDDIPAPSASIITENDLAVKVEHPVTLEHAMEVVEMMLNIAKDFCDDVQSLVSFWNANKKLIDLLDHNFKPAFSRLREGFTEIKQNILSKSGE